MVAYLEPGLEGFGFSGHVGEFVADYGCDELVIGFEVGVG